MITRWNINTKMSTYQVGVSTGNFERLASISLAPTDKCTLLSVEVLQPCKRVNNGIKQTMRELFNSVVILCLVFRLHTVAARSSATGNLSWYFAYDVFRSNWLFLSVASFRRPSFPWIRVANYLPDWITAHKVNKKERTMVFVCTAGQ